MGDESPKVKVAVVQAASVLFDREASVEKAVRLIAEAARSEPKLILFPEAFIPAYPRGLGFGTVVGDRKPEGRLTWERYWANSVEVPGPVTERLGRRPVRPVPTWRWGSSRGTASTAGAQSTAHCSTSAPTAG